MPQVEENLQWQFYFQLLMISYMEDILQILDRYVGNGSNYRLKVVSKAYDYPECLYHGSVWVWDLWESTCKPVGL